MKAGTAISLQLALIFVFNAAVYAGSYQYTGQAADTSTAATSGLNNVNAAIITNTAVTVTPTPTPTPGPSAASKLGQYALIGVGAIAGVTALYYGGKYLFSDKDKDKAPPPGGSTKTPTSPTKAADQTSGSTIRQNSGAAAGEGDVVAPVDGTYSVAGCFAQRSDSKQKLRGGVDLAASEGTKVVAMQDAEVVDFYDHNCKPDADPSDGCYVVIKLPGPDGAYLKYTHLQEGSITKAGVKKPLPFKVKKNQQIGSVGKSGRVSGPMLRLEKHIKKPNTQGDQLVSPTNDYAIIGQKSSNKLICPKALFDLPPEESGGTSGPGVR